MASVRDKSAKLDWVPAALRSALEFVAAECRSLEAPWWMIGSTAALLAGLRDLDPPDIDLLVSARDADSLFKRWNADRTQPAVSASFRSLFGVYKLGPVRIEIMGDLQICRDGNWQRLEPGTREAIATRAGEVYIPSRDEQIDILRLFGRRKDVERAALLESLSRRDIRSSSHD